MRNAKMIQAFYHIECVNFWYTGCASVLSGEAQASDQAGVSSQSGGLPSDPTAFPLKDVAL
jgi:hypothetical protein